jgi:hypothetical protein
MNLRAHEGLAVEQFGVWELLVNFGHLVVALLLVLLNLLIVALRWSLLLAWIAWWLWGVNWRRAWAFLAVGGWIPVALLAVLAALVWSRIAPGPYRLEDIAIANFWWQLVAVGLLVGLALFCGWLQGVLGWAPAEIDLEPPQDDTTHGHEHPVGTLGHHDAAHADEPQDH